MNKYIVPICDIQAGLIYNKKIIARTLEQCKEKLLQYFLDEYDFVSDLDSYRDTIKLLDEHDVLVGQIKDIEEL